MQGACASGSTYLPGEVVEAQLEREGVEPSGEGDSQAHDVERSATRSMSGTIGGLRLRIRGARMSSLGRSLVHSVNLSKALPFGILPWVASPLPKVSPLARRGKM